MRVGAQKGLSADSAQVGMVQGLEGDFRGGSQDCMSQEKGVESKQS